MAPNDLGDRLLTIPEVAQILQVQRNYVYLRIREGEIRTTNLGTGGRSKMRVSRSELDRFIDSRTR